jgi:hypothetical protein
MAQAQAIVVGPSIPPTVIPECDHKDGCDRPATFSYLWDWGVGGKACSVHAALLQQTAGNLQRTVTVSALVPVGPVSLTRDERTRLKAETYALEAEIEDVKARGLALYTENGTLTRTAQAAVTRARETEAQLKDALGEIDNLKAKLEERDAVHGTLVDEVSRLRLLASFEQSTDHSRVDGT